MKAAAGLWGRAAETNGGVAFHHSGSGWTTADPGGEGDSARRAREHVHTAPHPPRTNGKRRGVKLE